MAMVDMTFGHGGKRACEIQTGTWYVSSMEARTDGIPRGASTLRATVVPSSKPQRPQFIRYSR